MKISSILIAFVSVVVAVPLPINNEHVLSARGFRSTLSGMNPFFGKNKANQINELHTNTLKTKITTNAEDVAIQGMHSLNFAGVFGSTKKTENIAKKSTIENNLANSAFTKARDARTKATDALTKQNSARKARQEVLKPTGFRDAFSKVGTAVSKTASAARANSKANAASKAAFIEFDKTNQARRQTIVAMNA